MSKILIADDAPFMRVMIRDILNRLGYDDVEEAADGQTAVEKYRQLNPDLVMLDITMPGLNGIDALKAIKHINPDAKVVMCAVVGQEATLRVEATRLGALGFIAKSFKPDRMMRESIAKTVKAILG